MQYPPKSVGDRTILLAYEAGYRVTNTGIITKPDGTPIKPRKPVKHRHNAYQAFGAKGGQAKVHRFVAFCKFGHKLFAPGIMVRHLDDNRDNNRPDNLEIGTMAENLADARRNHNGHWAKPRPPENRRFSPEQVKEIRRQVAAGATLKETAIAFGGTQASDIQSIVSFEAYQDVPVDSETERLLKERAARSPHRKHHIWTRRESNTIITKLTAKDRPTIQQLANSFKVSRQALLRKIDKLIAEKQLIKDGAGTEAAYRIPVPDKE